MKKLALLLILLVSCQFVQLPGRRGPQPLPQIYVGTSALEADFTPASMSDILMCKEADFFLFLRNSGAFDIDGTYSFIFEEQYLKPLDRWVNKFSLPGRSQFNPEGGIDQIEFSMRNPGLPVQFESHDTQIIFQACYPYKTFASAPVCIDPDVQNMNPRKPCRAEPVSLSGGQGAPVAVTRVESLMVPERDRVRPSFKIFVQQVGAGQVITKEGTSLACGAGRPSDRQLLSYVDINATLQNRKLECSPNPVRLEPGAEAGFVCDADELFGLASATFASVLSIELSYGFITTATLPVKITRLPGQLGC